MPLLPEITIIDLEMVDILIKKQENEQNEQNKVQNRPFLQIPIPDRQDLQKKEDRLLKDLLVHTNKQLIQDKTFSPCASGIPSASGVNPCG